MTRDPQKKLATSRRYFANHRQERREAVLRSYYKYREERLEYARTKRSADPEAAKEYGRAQYAKHRDARMAKAQEWKAAHREHLRDYDRKQHPKKMQDPNFRMATRLRSSIHVRLNGVKKAGRTFELIGCSIIELRAHLESQFRPGMTWDNRGYRGWHIDHIRPVSSFDLTDPVQQRQCFHYSNLQPLWAKENMSKGKKVAA